MPVAKLTLAQNRFVRLCDVRSITARITDMLIWLAGAESVEQMTDEQCAKAEKEIKRRPDWRGTAGI